jgi:hypothetical protein
MNRDVALFYSLGRYVPKYLPLAIQNIEKAIALDCEDAHLLKTHIEDWREEVNKKLQGDAKDDSSPHNIRNVNSHKIASSLPPPKQSFS